MLEDSWPQLQKNRPMSSTFPLGFPQDCAPAQDGKCGFCCPHFLQQGLCSVQSVKTVMGPQCHLHTLIIATRKTLCGVGLQAPYLRLTPP